MRHNSRRVEAPQRGSGDCGDLDVMVVRELSLRRSRPIRHALTNLEQVSSGLILPKSIGEIALKVFGSSSLKSIAGKKTKRGFVIDQDNLDSLGDEIFQTFEFEDLSLEVANPDEPFSIDDYDQLVVELKDTPQLDADKVHILQSVRSRLSPIEQTGEDIVEDFRPPTIIVGEVQLQTIELGEEHERFINDPNGFLANLLLPQENRDIDGGDDPELFPAQICFGALKVITRDIVPASFSKLKVIEARTSGIFGADNKLKKTDEPWWSDELDRIVS